MMQETAVESKQKLNLFFGIKLIKGILVIEL